MTARVQNWLALSVRTRVLVYELPSIFPHHSLNIVYRIRYLISWRSIADLQENAVLFRTIFQVMGGAAGRETGDHSRAQFSFSCLGDQRRLAL
jgi:hypothetical protein